jgi:hypothetical protein
MTAACFPRSAEYLQGVILSLAVETNPAFEKRTITINGKSVVVTWCNTFLRAVLTALGLPMPAVLANAIVDWLNSNEGKKAGWRVVDVFKAEELANEGKPVVVGVKLPGHGHVAIGVPSPDGTHGLHIAQAGRSNFSCKPVAAGFGKHQFTVWAHE